MKKLFLLSLLSFLFTACPNEKKKENELTTYFENSMLLDMLTKYDCVTGNDVISDTYNEPTTEFVLKQYDIYSQNPSSVVPKAYLHLIAKTGQTLQVSSITSNVQYQGAGNSFGYSLKKSGCHGASISFIGPSNAFASSTEVYVNANSQTNVEFKFTQDFDGILMISGLHVGDPLPGDIKLRVF
ncbi:hypothetical protein CH379_002185 [Leptospira ellisii]|uniref:Lipoprotein n=1 Tax=Leptospira ellisii TaxID=2023197 RepID=A0A2N0B633_9LEPT|nr:hypothetical protein [Leptospira ellisii]MDV6234435.1 hypothetical protein [Leptospira ellisii]PJZ92009.1 hypothetical protein CH379_15535 [Leptospira ellisii]PKA05230.1 hypothetical protein CH375_06310 [Leptospira ellisii]